MRRSHRLVNAAKVPITRCRILRWNFIRWMTPEAADSAHIVRQ
jgi:hypothetical protein